MLVEHGARIDLGNATEAATPLHWAALGGRARTLHYLVTCGGNLHGVDKRGYNALLHAAQQGHTVNVHYALHQGVPIDWCARRARSPRRTRAR